MPRSNAVWKKFLNVILGHLFGLVGSYAEKNANWIIPSVELVLLVPFFFLSWWIESFVVSGMLEAVRPDRISRAVLVANLWSYALLALVPVWFLIQSRKKLLVAIRDVRAVRLIHDGFAADGRRMTADQYGTIRFFDAQTGKQMEVIAPVRAEVDCKAVSSDGRLSLVGDERGHAVWEHAIKKELCRLEDDDYFDAVAFSPNAQYLAAVAEGAPAVRLWSCQTGRLLLSGNVIAGYSIAFSPDSRMLAVNGRKADAGVAYVWDLETRELIRTLDGQEEYPEVKFSADGRQLAVEDHGEIFVYRTDDWELDQVLEGKDRRLRDWV